MLLDGRLMAPVLPELDATSCEDPAGSADEGKIGTTSSGGGGRLLLELTFPLDEELLLAISPACLRTT